MRPPLFLQQWRRFDLPLGASAYPYLYLYSCVSMSVAMYVYANGYMRVRVCLCLYGGVWSCLAGTDCLCGTCRCRRAGSSPEHCPVNAYLCSMPFCANTKACVCVASVSPRVKNEENCLHLPRKISSVLFLSYLSRSSLLQMSGCGWVLSSASSSCRRVSFRLDKTLVPASISVLFSFSSSSSCLVYKTSVLRRTDSTESSLSLLPRPSEISVLLQSVNVFHHSWSLDSVPRRHRGLQKQSQLRGDTCREETAPHPHASPPSAASVPVPGALKRTIRRKPSKISCISRKPSAQSSSKASEGGTSFVFVVALTDTHASLSPFVETLFSKILSDSLRG